MTAPQMSQVHSWSDDVADTSELSCDWISDALLGESDVIAQVRGQVREIAHTSIPVLIQGPTGVGKEIVAQGLHRMSGRTGAMVAVNVCAVPEGTFDSTLFGHVKGAFTGALRSSAGHFTEAHRGTLFLDEIGELALPLQAKLLRVLETRSYRPVGASCDHTSDFRLVTATNACFHSAVSRGAFRSDLLYRIGGVVIEIPPLRERPEDVAPIARRLVRLATAGHGSITASALRFLESYDWPGNVREMVRVLDLACSFAREPLVDAEQVRVALSRMPLAANAKAVEPSAPDDERMERLRLLDVLQHSGWHIPTAAAALGVTRKTVYKRIHRLGIVIPRRYHRRAAADDGERTTTATTLHMA